MEDYEEDTEDPSIFIEDKIVSVLINTCYGGFGISKDGIDLYNKKLLEKDPSAKAIKYDMDIMDRHDPILYEVYKELGEKINSKYSKLTVAIVPKKYVGYYKIKEYDGMEYTEIDYNKYTMNKIEKVLHQDDMDPIERIETLKQIMEEHKSSWNWSYIFKEGKVPPVYQTSKSK